jgi:hypothetical protein
MLFRKLNSKQSSKPLSKATLSDEDCNASIDSAQGLVSYFNYGHPKKEPYGWGISCYNEDKKSYAVSVENKVPARQSNKFDK